MNLADFQANELASLIMAETIHKVGITDIVMSPGSRSTPLTYTFATDSRFATYPVLDERSAGFFALGLAKNKRCPVVLLCTSGTASANYLPAIVEARYSHTPLIVLTADRPPHQQDCHAGQTIDQVGIYSNFVNWQLTLALPQSTETHLRYLRETMKAACVRAMNPQPGVVHFNVPFEEPLCPASTDSERETMRLFIAGMLASEIDIPTMAHYDASAPVSESILRRVQECEKPLIVVGPCYAGADEPMVCDLVELAGKLKAPIVADALNPLRNHAQAEHLLVRNFEFLLRSEKQKEGLKPDLVLLLGDLPTSKTLRGALNNWGCDLICLGQGIDNRDPGLSQLVANQVSIGGLRAAITKDRKLNDYIEQWKDRDDRVERAKTTAFDKLQEWAEPVLCRELASMLSSTSDLFVSNSMIVRDMEAYWLGSSKVQRVLTNRGANGIDGIVSTAFGAAKSRRPLLCLTGDLAFLHDAGGLLLKKHLVAGERIAFLLLDNKGGGIFEHLPISKRNPPFETYFATPQEVDVKKLCESYHIDYQSITDQQSLAENLGEFLSGKTGNCVCMHLKFDRKASYRLRKEVTACMMDLINEL